MGRLILPSSAPSSLRSPPGRGEVRYNPDTMALDFPRFDALLASDPLEALDLAKTAVRELSGERSCRRARALDALGTAFRVIGDYPKAEASYDEAKTICACPACHPDRLLRLTYLRAMQGDHDEAVAIGRRALGEARTDESAARARVALAFAYHVAGDYGHQRFVRKRKEVHGDCDKQNSPN